MTVGAASTHDASRSLASSRHRVGANPQRTSRPPSVKWPKVGQQHQRQPGNPSKPPQFERKGVSKPASPQHASTADASSRHRKGVEDQGIDRRTSTRRHRGDDSSASGFGEGPTASSCATRGPPNQSHRGFHRTSQEAVPRSLRFPFRHKFGTIGGTVAVGAKWFGGLKNQRSTRLVEIVHPSGPTFSRFGPPPFEAHLSRAPHFVVPKFNIHWPKSKLAEVEIGRSRNWPKSKLAEKKRAARSRNWPKSITPPMDTTLVSPLRRDGTARARAANHDGAALERCSTQERGHLPRTFR